jgi:hypothetical protein
MKSFADWTDEIRQLMNPPKAMVDTCNLAALEDYEEGFFTPTLTFDTADGADSTAEHFYTRIGDTVTIGGPAKRYGDTVWPESNVLLESFVNRYGKGELGSWQQQMYEKLAGAQWPDTVGFGSGRRCGKTTLRAELRRQLFYGGAQWDQAYMDAVVKGSGTVEFTQAIDPADFSHIEQRAGMNTHDQSMLDQFRSMQGKRPQIIICDEVAEILKQDWDKL